MTHKAVTVLTYILLILGVHRAHGARVDVGANARHFSVLCSVYAAIHRYPESIYDKREMDGIIEKIDVINVSLSDDNWFAEIVGSGDPSKAKEDFKSEESNIEARGFRWKKAAKEVAKGVEFEKISSSVQAVKVAQAKLRVIEKQVEKILDAIGKQVKSAQLDEIKKKFDEAIGTPGSSGRGTNRATVCGAQNLPNKGSEAGNDLVVDFLCLCAQDASHSSSGTNGAEGDECGGEAPGTSVPAWSTSGDSIAKNKENDIWKKLTSACLKGRPEGSHQVSNSREVRVAMNQFWQAVQEGSKEHTGADKTPGLFGTLKTTKGTVGCAGYHIGGPNICIFYGKAAEWPNLKWPRAVQEGILHLEVAENATLAIQHEITRLKILYGQAEEIYEEAKMAAEAETSGHEKPTQIKNQKQNSSSATSQATAQERNTVNKAAISHFILPWTLLI